MNTEALQYAGELLAKNISLDKENEKLKNENQLLKEQLKMLKEDITAIYQEMISLDIITKKESEDIELL